MDQNSARRTRRTAVSVGAFSCAVFCSLALLVAPLRAAVPLSVPADAAKAETLKSAKPGNATILLAGPATGSGALALRATSASGWSAASAPKSEQRGDKTVVTLKPKDQLVVTPPATPAKQPAQLSTAATTSSGVLLAVSEDAQVEKYRLFLRVLSLPLRWDPQQQAYSSQLELGLASEDPSAPVKTLSSPIVVTLTGKYAKLSPFRVSLTATGESSYQQVTVAADHHDFPLEVDAFSDLGDQKFALGPADIDAGIALKLSASQNAILGFGIGAAEVAVSPLALDGTVLAATPWVELSTSAGTLASPHLQIDASTHRATTQLRSSGRGKVTISASAPPAKADLDLTFLVPWTYLAFALAGAALGAIGGGRLRFKQAQLSVRHQLGGIAIGLLAGLVLLVALLVIPEQTPGLGALASAAARSELGWGACALIGSLAGLETVARWLFNKLGLAPVSEGAVPAAPK